MLSKSDEEAVLKFENSVNTCCLEHFNSKNNSYLPKSFEYFIDKSVACYLYYLVVRLKIQVMTT